MSLPTRVQRNVVADPFEAAQREFDMLNRFFGGNSSGQSDGGRLAPYGVDIREDARPYLCRGGTARLQEG